MPPFNRKGVTMASKRTGSSTALNALIKRAGPLVTFTAGVDGITDLRELDEQDPPPLYAPGTPALDLFHRCLLPAIKAFDAALAKAYRTVQDRTHVQIGAADFTPTQSAFEATGVKYKAHKVAK
jgi:hypothetical protein